MKRFWRMALLCTAVALECRAQEFLDTLEQKMTLSFFDDRLRARVSGTLDLEGYGYTQPAPWLINADGHGLFNPRLSLFVDAQIGPKLYFFLQARADRGFDPSDGPAQGRFDEYALRFTPWEDGRVNLQVGQFSTIVGNWVSRHLSWDNPFINAPLPYEHITGASDIEPAFSAAGLLARVAEEKYEFNPVIWGPSYATGASIAGRWEKFDWAAEIKNAPLTSRPEAWSISDSAFDQPTFSGRVGYRPSAKWNLGVSASDGAYIRPEAAYDLPPGSALGDFHQTLIGQDIGFAYHHWQFWAEFFESRFELPRLGTADTFTYYFETKYKFTPQLFGAFRWNQQFFSRVSDEFGNQTKWGRDVWRLEPALGYRFTAHAQLKLQYSLQQEDGDERRLGHVIAGQFTVRF